MIETTRQTRTASRRTRFAAVGVLAFLGAAMLPVLAAAQPTIATLNPSTVVARQQFFGTTVTIAVTGTNFAAGNTTASFNGVDRATTVGGATNLTFVVPVSELATAGTYKVKVTNAAAPNAGDSGELNFTVTDPVAPTVTVVNPNTAVAGSAQFQVNITGTGFTRDTVFRWNGQDRAGGPTGATSGTMIVLASDVASASGSPAKISAFTPTPGGGTSQDVNFTITAVAAPANPTITSLSPNSARVDGATFDLVVNGTNFTTQSVVKWGGSARPTTYLSPNQLRAYIPASDLAVAFGTVNVTVETTGAAAGSNTSVFTLTALVAPTISNVTTPISARTGAAQISVNGANFTPNSVVRWNGQDRLTIYNTGNFLSARLQESDVAVAGVGQVTVFTPGTTASSALPVTVVNPLAPVIASLSPAQLTISVTNQLYVTGVGFTTDAIVRVNGVDRATQFISSTQLIAQLLPTDVSALGRLQITVYTPAPGGGTSAAEPIEVIPYTRPILSRISPNIVQVGAAASEIILTSDASNFTADSRVRVGGVERPTTYQNSNTLRATVAASDVAAAGSKAVTVFSPGANAESDPVQLTVGNALTPVVSSLQCGSNQFALSNCAEVLSRSDSLVLRALGRNFTSQSVILVNGNARPTTFDSNSGTQLTATLSQADIAASGTLVVKVTTPTAAADSNVINLPVVNPGAPTITTVASLQGDTYVTVGSYSSVSMRVSGTGFVRDSVVKWNGVEQPTTYQSGNVLVAQVSGSEFRTAGTALVSVSTPAPGGGVSGNAAYPIVAPSTPQITQLTPAQVTAGGTGGTVAVIGANFTNASVVNWNGNARPTNWNGSVGNGLFQLNAQFSSADIATAGTAVITVTTPGAPATSNSMQLVIQATGTPTIRLLQPESLTAGAPGASVAILGTNFNQYSRARWNGSERQTTYNSPTQVTMWALPSDLASAGSGTITVANGGLVSGGVALPVGNPTVPQITSLTPAFSVAGSNGVELLVNGPAAGLRGAFAPTSVINWNGAAKPTTYISATQLRTFLTMADLATAGTAQVTVTTPAPGGGTSTAANFLINNPTGPVITSLSQFSAVAGSPEFTLTVVGQNFVAGRSVINWKGAALPTQWNSGTQLSALIPAAELAAVGSADVTVVTSGPGGGTSIAVPFEIVAPSAPDITSVSTSISSTTVTAGTTAFTLIVNGNGFTPQSVVNWNGTPLSTVYSGGQLAALVPAANVATAGIANITVSTPGAPTSDSVVLVIANTNGPVLTRLNPARVYAGGFASTVSAIGTFDCSGVTALVNGQPRQAFVSGCSNVTQVTTTANVPLVRTDIAAAGTVSIAIQAMTQSGALTSIALPLTVVNPPAPVITGLNPAVFRDRRSMQTLNIQGANFVRGSVLYWNGTPRNTSVSNEGLLSAQISAADLASAGTATITVVTPSPGGGTSNALVVQIEDPRVPTITSASSLSTVRSGDQASSLNLQGTGFVVNSIVSWNGTVLQSGYSSETSMYALVPAALLRTPGTVQVTVTTPAPGGGTSAPYLVQVTDNPSNVRITDISPDSVPRGSGDTTITVYGEGFLPSSVVEVDSPISFSYVPLATTYVSATTLTAVVPASMLRTATSRNIRVDGSTQRSWRVHDAYYFGEGVTGPFFDTEYAITNTSTSSTQNVTMTFAKDNGSVVRRTYSIAPQRTLRVPVDAIPGMESAPFSTLVEARSIASSASLLVQRDVRWGTPTYGRHTVAGLTTGTEWYFGEGVDSSVFDTYLLLGNFGSASATATVTAVRNGDVPVTTTIAVPANTRVTVNLGKQVAGLSGKQFGFSVTSDQPIVAERAVYGSGPRAFEFGNVSAGVPRPSNLWVLPEGAAGSLFDSYHTIANFGTSPVDVRITILSDTGQSFQRLLSVPAQARATFSPDVDPELASLGGFAAKIEALNGEVVAELAQYAAGPNGYYESHGGPGVVPASVDSNNVGTFPYYWQGIGYYGGGTNDDTFILVANPNATDTTVRTTCVSEGGLPMGFTDTAIGPNARATIAAVSACSGLATSQGAFSYTVTSLDSQGVVVGASSFTTAAGERLFSAGTFTVGIR